MSKIKSIVLLSLITMLFSVNVLAQNAKYKVFITDHLGHLTKGKFLASNDQAVSILKRGDTLLIPNVNISSLFLYRRGLIFPITTLAVITTLFVGIAVGGLGIIIALPVVGGAASFLAYLGAKRESYDKVKPAHFSKITAELRQYAVKP